MPLFKRTTSSVSAANSTGFLSIGCKPSASKEGQFAFSNSPYNTGSNQFTYLICETNTQGVGFGGFCSTGYLHLILNNNYYQQAWSVKNDIIAVGENVDGTHGEYFNSQINSFVFSEANAAFQLIESEAQIKNKSQYAFDANVYLTESGLRYEFVDTDSTKMKWTSRIEVIQNIATGIPTPFSFASVESQISNGVLPENAIFSEGSNDAIIIEAGEDDGTLDDTNIIEAGID